MNEKFYINSLQPQFANGGQIKCLMLVAGGACGAGASHLIPTSHFTSEQIMLSSSPTSVQSLNIKQNYSNADDKAATAFRTPAARPPAYVCSHPFWGILQRILAEKYDFMLIFGPPILWDTRPTPGC